MIKDEINRLPGFNSIPSGWKVIRTKYCFDKKKSKANKNNPTILSLARDGVKIRDLSDNKGQFAEDYSEYNPVDEGDLLLNPMDLYSGDNCNLSRITGVISPAYINLRAKENVNPEFFNYFFKTQYWTMAFHSKGKGVDEKRRWVLSDEEIKNYPLIVPNYSEQCELANYLNNKIDNISAIIDKHNLLVTKLEELKQSIITKTVFYGLSKNVEYKDSETNWAGKIPVNWTVMPLKTRFNFSKGLSITKADLVDEGLPVISYGQVHAKFNSGVRVDESLIRYVPETFAQYKESFAHNNDFIFADTSEDLEGCGNCVYVDNNGVYAGYHTVLLSSKYDDNNKYLAYLFKTDAWRYQIRTQLTDVKLFSITQGCLRQVKILLPPQPEQDDIVKYLDAKCSKIDESIKRQKEIIEKLDEYKKSLIYNVVTGKTEVPNDSL